MKLQKRWLLTAIAVLLGTAAVPAAAAPTHHHHARHKAQGANRHGLGSATGPRTAQRGAPCVTT